MGGLAAPQPALFCTNRALRPRTYDNPHEVVASPDGRLAFVSNYGGGSFNTITVVDLVERKNLAPINLGALRGPHGLMFVAGKLWFTAEGAEIVGSYDPAAKEVDLVIGTGQNRTHMVFVMENQQRPDNYVVIVDLKSLEVVGRIEAGRQPDGLAWAARP